MDYNKNKQKIVVASLHTFTTISTYNDIGGEIDCRGYKQITIFINLVKNSSSIFRFLLKGKYDSGDNSQEFMYPLNLMTGTQIMVLADESYFSTANASGLYILHIPLNDAIPYLQLMGRTIILGAIPATASVYATLGY